MQLTMKVFFIKTSREKKYLDYVNSQIEIIENICKDPKYKNRIEFFIRECYSRDDYLSIYRSMKEYKDYPSLSLVIFDCLEDDSCVEYYIQSLIFDMVFSRAKRWFLFSENLWGKDRKLNQGESQMLLKDNLNVDFGIKFNEFLLKDSSAMLELILHETNS